MSFLRYPEYKNSGVEWLGEVPAHWGVVPLRGTAKQEAYSFTDGDWVETPFITDEGVRLIQTGNVGVGKYREQGFRYISEETFSKLNCTEFFPGDVLICRLADPVGRACLAPDLGARMITSVDVCILKTKSEISSNFLVYFLSSDPYLSFMASVSRGGTRERVSRSFLGGVRILMPSVEEQSTIAAFLDHETARIDALVEEQKRLIELLKEKRQAVISHAVTKGLDPDVPMKDSGVEWLGEVPAHWDVKSLMHLTPPDRKIMYGIVLPGPDFDGGVPIIKGGDVKPGRLLLEKLCRTDPKIEAKYERSRVTSGDIVYSIRGGIGDAEIVPEEISGSNLTQDAARVAPRDGVCNVWLLYVLKSGPVFAQLEAKATGATIRGINIMDLKRAALPVPPLQEQQQIAERLDFIIGKLDRLEKEAGEAITLMQEHRSALISAAVTGKIDVRGWQPPAGSPAHKTPQTEMV